MVSILVDRISVPTTLLQNSGITYRQIITIFCPRFWTACCSPSRPSLLISNLNKLGIPSFCLFSHRYSDLSPRNNAIGNVHYFTRQTFKIHTRNNQVGRKPVEEEQSNHYRRSTIHRRLILLDLSSEDFFLRGRIPVD